MIMRMQMRPTIGLIKRFKHPAFTPTGLHSEAQRRAVPCEAS